MRGVAVDGCVGKKKEMNEVKSLFLCVGRAAACQAGWAVLGVRLGCLRTKAPHRVRGLTFFCACAPAFRALEEQKKGLTAARLQAARLTLSVGERGVLNIRKSKIKEKVIKKENVRLRKSGHGRRA